MQRLSRARLADLGRLKPSSRRDRRNQLLASGAKRLVGAMRDTALAQRACRDEEASCRKIAPHEIRSTRAAWKKTRRSLSAGADLRRASHLRCSISRFKLPTGRERVDEYPLPAPPERMKTPRFTSAFFDWRFVTELLRWDFGLITQVASP